MSQADLLRFGPFLFDPVRLELSREGRPVKLQPQPAQVLAALLARAGHPVTREELRQAVWRDDTFVDFDRGLNFCISQIRIALGDDAATPAYVRTLPKIGYEFVSPVTTASAAVPEVSASRSRLRIVAVLVATVALVFVAALALTRRAAPPVVAVAHFDNDTGDPSLAPFIDSLTDAVVERLTTHAADRYLVVGNASVLRKPREDRDLLSIGSQLGARYVVLGQVQRDDTRLRVLAHLIRLPEQTHLAVSRTENLEPGQTLTLVDDLAGRIVQTIDAKLRDPDGRAAR